VALGVLAREILTLGVLAREILTLGVLAPEVRILGVLAREVLTLVRILNALARNGAVATAVVLVLARTGAIGLHVLGTGCVRVELVGVLAALVEFLSRRVDGVPMGGGDTTQPGGFGGLGFRLGLSGLGLGLGLLCDEVALFDVLVVFLDFFADPLRLEVAVFVAAFAGQHRQCGDDQQRNHYSDDNPDNGVVVHVGSFGRSGMVSY
jgi:hypothetical protein